jgi:hypothetical protein
MLPEKHPDEIQRPPAWPEEPFDEYQDQWVDNEPEEEEQQ